MTTIRQTGIRVGIAIAALLALAIGAAAATAAPGSIRALDLSAPSLGSWVQIAAPGGGTFSADPGRAVMRVTPAGGPATQVLAWCVDPDHSIAEGIDYPVDLQTPADTPALADPGYAQAGWLIASSDGLIAAAAAPGLEAAAIQVAVWQLTGKAVDTAAVTDNATLNTRVAQIRALAAGRTLVTALALSAPAAPVAPGTPVSVTVTGTPGAVVDLAVTSGAATLSAPQVVLDSSGAAQVTLTPTAAGSVAIAASAQGGTLNRAAHLAGWTAPQDMAFVTPVTLTAAATVAAVAPPVTPPTVVAPVTVTQVPVARLGLAKRAPARVRRGRVISYRLTVTNTSATVARDVVVRDPIPVGTSVTRLPARARMRTGAVVWRIGTLAPGASVTVRLSLRTNPVAQGDILNVATASAANAAPVRARATTRVLLPRRVAPAVVVPVTG